MPTVYSVCKIVRTIVTTSTWGSGSVPDTTVGVVGDVVVVVVDEELPD
jgi:hypothetical protein